MEVVLHTFKTHLILKSITVCLNLVANVKRMKHSHQFHKPLSHKPFLLNEKSQKCSVHISVKLMGLQQTLVAIENQNWDPGWVSDLVKVKLLIGRHDIWKLKFAPLNISLRKYIFAEIKQVIWQHRDFTGGQKRLLTGEWERQWGKQWRTGYVCDVSIRGYLQRNFLSLYLSVHQHRVSL